MPWDMGGRGLDRPPSLEEVISKLQDKFRGKMPKIPGVWIALAIVALIWIVSSVYTVAVDEVGVVQRFGKYIRTTQPGLHIKLPKGIEKITKVRVRRVYKEEFGLRTIRAGVETKYAPSKAYMGESLMLTGDLNVGVVPWIVQYRINDPYKYLFKVRDVRSTLRDLSEAIMRQVVGDRSINEVISKRQEIADEAKVMLQEALNEAETGLRLVTVEMKTTTVPEPVQPSFNEVNQAIQEKEKMIYQAKEEYNKSIPAAKGEAQKTIKGAEGYYLDRINRAKGDAARFTSMWKEYTKAKDVTRRRLYLEALHDLFPKLGNKYIVDSELRGVLPLLNLGQMGEGEKK
jgi:membrane protease subunit HflK